jgi:pilus assembly protein CpaC
VSHACSRCWPVLGALLLSGLTPPAAAQTLPPIPPGLDQAAEAGVIISRPITIRAGTGAMIQLPRPAATVIAAEPRVARVQPVSPTSLFVVGVAQGKTTIVATANGGAVIAQYDVTVAPGATPPDQLTAQAQGAGAAAGAAPGTGTRRFSVAVAREVEKAIHQMVPGSAGVRVSPAGSLLQVSGLVATPEQAQRAMTIARGFAGETNVTDALEILSSVQVNLRVRVAEMSRQITRQLGINWQVTGSKNFLVGMFTGAGTTGALSAVAPVTSTASGLSTPFSFGGGYKSSTWDVNAVVDALAEDNLISILAEPNLTALSGESASFLSGGEYPVPISANNNGGGTTVTVSYKQYGVSLSFVPTVLGPDRVNLKVRPEVSSLTSQGAVSYSVSGGTVTIPALLVRRAETTVELGSGQSFAIAGLLESNTNQDVQSLPGIGEIPLLGSLFRTTSMQRTDNELVIIITPYLVKPVRSPHDLALPTDSFHPATDLDRILFGHTVASTARGRRLDAGFVME